MSRTQQIEHTDSISSQDPHQEEKKKTKSRRPANTAFRQQRLKAWQPILTPKTVLPLFFVVGIIFAPIGGLLLYASSQVQEIAINYTECIAKAPLAKFELDPTADRGLQPIPSKFVTNSFKSEPNPKPKWGRAENQDYKWERTNHTEENVSVCILEFNIPNDIKAPVLFYYRLTNFYQNHRRYVKSLDIEQLKGKARTADQIKSGECDPLEVNHENKPYYPCGLIANSMFNDTFDDMIRLDSSSSGTEYKMSDKGISWKSERDLYGVSEYASGDVVPPPNWVKQYSNGDYVEKLPDLKTWEAFQVWMRTAGLPTFSKLAKRNDKETLQKGTYRLRIFDRYPVTSFGGTKSILISTSTVMGGKNPFLGIAYVVVGGLCILLGAVFTATHLIKPRKLGDHTYLSWNNDQPSTATATGRSSRPGDTA